MPGSGYFETAFAPDAPTARYIRGVKITAARSAVESGDVGSHLIASSLYATGPPCPTATNRVPKRMARKSCVSGGAGVMTLQVVPSGLGTIVAESPPTTDLADAPGADP